MTGSDLYKYLRYILKNHYLYHPLKIASKHSSYCSASGSADNLVVPSTSTASPDLSHNFDDFNLSSDECDKDEFMPKWKGRFTSSSSDDSSDSELEAKMQGKHTSEQPVFVWQKKENVPKRFSFCARPGVNVSDLHQGSTPFEIYSHFFTPELMDCLVQETNRYDTFLSLFFSHVTVFIFICMKA